MDRFSIITVAALMTFGSVSPGWATDNTLYESPPPDDAAFLRWIGKRNAPKIFGVELPNAEGSDFHPVSSARTEGARSGAYYSAAYDAMGRLVVVEEPERANHSKVLVTLINLSGTPVRLTLTDQKVVVIGDTATSAANGREVNPVAAKLSVVSDTDAVLGVFDVQFRRGQNMTFVARPDSVDLIENRFGPNIEG